MEKFIKNNEQESIFPHKLYLDIHEEGRGKEARKEMALEFDFKAYAVTEQLLQKGVYQICEDILRDRLSRTEYILLNYTASLKHLQIRDFETFWSKIGKKLVKKDIAKKIGVLFIKSLIN